MTETLAGLRQRPAAPMDAIKERSRQEAEKKDKLNPCVRGASKGRSAMRNSTRRSSMRNPRASRRPTRTGTLALPSTRSAPRHILPTERSSPPWQMCTYERVTRSNFLVLLEVQLLWLLAPDSPKNCQTLFDFFLKPKTRPLFPKSSKKGVRGGAEGGRREVQRRAPAQSQLTSPQRLLPSIPSPKLPSLALPFSFHP